MHFKVPQFISITIILATLVSAHRGKESDSLKELDPNGALDKAELSFTLESENLGDKDHKKKEKTKDDDDIGRKKKKKSKESIDDMGEEDNESDKKWREDYSGSQEENKKDGKQEKSRARKGHKEDDKKQEIPLTKNSNKEEDYNQTMLGMEQQGDEAKASNKPSKANDKGIDMADAFSGQIEPKANASPSALLPSLSGESAKTTASSPQPQGSSTIARVSNSTTGLISTPASTAKVGKSAASTVKGGTWMVVSLAAFVSYYQI